MAHIYCHTHTHTHRDTLVMVMKSVARLSPAVLMPTLVGSGTVGMMLIDCTYAEMPAICVAVRVAVCVVVHQMMLIDTLRCLLSVSQCALKASDVKSVGCVC